MRYCLRLRKPTDGSTPTTELGQDANGEAGAASPSFTAIARGSRRAARRADARATRGSIGSRIADGGTRCGRAAFNEDGGMVSAR
jgi:hypothetical protein